MNHAMSHAMNLGKSTLQWFALLLLAGLAPPVLADEQLNTSSLQLRFNPQGELVEATACYPHCDDQAASQLHLHADQGLISFGQPQDASWVQRRGLDGSVHQLHFSNRAGQEVTWTIPQEGFRLAVRVTGAERLILRSGENFKPRPAPGFGGWLEQVRFIGISSAGVDQIGLDETDTSQLHADWAGFRNRFWTLLASGETEGVFSINTSAESTGAELSRAHEQGNLDYLFYLGPVEPTELAAVDEILSDVLYAGLWEWLRWICFALFYLLGWIQSVVPVWGIAIMLLSLCVHILMLPLSRIADRLQQQVNTTEARLAPELARIKREYKGEKQAAKIIALYKTERVHPLYSLKSMAGVAVVIPVFIGAFDMLAENINLLNTSFLWISDLSRPDALMALGFELPFFGAQFNLLPLIMTLLSVLASVLHNPPTLDRASRNRQVRNMLLLAVVFFVLFYTFPAGMVLYWTTNNLISVSKSLWQRLTRRATGQTGVPIND